MATLRRFVRPAIHEGRVHRRGDVVAVETLTPRLEAQTEPAAEVAQVFTEALGVPVSVEGEDDGKPVRRRKAESKKD